MRLEAPKLNGSTAQEIVKTMPKRSRKDMIARQVTELKESIRLGAQQLRLKTLNDLERTFNLASALARGQIKTQTENDKTTKVTLEQKKMWLLVAEQTALIIHNVVSGLDEHKLINDLEKLEQLVKEAKTTKHI